MVAIMKRLCFSFIVLASLATLFSVADAHRYSVGGNGDWVENPHESYNSWAARNRFQVNDTLYFKYAKGSDSVQVVTKADYDACNVNNPIEKFDNGDTEVALNRSGPFYFISGIQEHCSKGQKLIVAVLGHKNHPVVPVSPAKAPSTAQPPKAHSPVSPVAPAKSPSTAQPPKSHSPVSPVAPAKAPKAHSPVSPISPAKSPSMTQPPNAHSPVSPVAPAKAPSASHPPKSSVHPPQHSAPSPVAHSPSVSPSKAPTTSPVTHSPPPKSPSPSSPKSPSPAAPTTPSAKPPKSTPATPADSSPTPSESTPTDHMAPAPSPKSAATVVTVSSVMSALFGVAFTVLLFA
ncbi:hypothetical protein Bca4012_025037 [Brassica carinata]|uniref:Phytocyanin domain-containing protein n=1 Tax=Brassica carinata TaxID=52824 RepID=A0A8X8ASM4_BRACI|nr:hypothetical protein Bca52824_022079 [Brassica carinata]